MQPLIELDLQGEIDNELRQSNNAHASEQLLDSIVHLYMTHEQDRYQEECEHQDKMKRELEEEARAQAAAKRQLELEREDAKLREELMDRHEQTLLRVSQEAQEQIRQQQDEADPGAGDALGCRA